MFLVMIVGMWIVATPASAVDGRKFTITYNAALSKHEAAVPNKFAKPGDIMRITYRKQTLRVRAVYGGCTCFDISDEGMNELASTSQGVIRANVKVVGK